MGGMLSKVTFDRYVYAKNAKNPPKIVHTIGKNFVAIVRNEVLKSLLLFNQK